MLGPAPKFPAFETWQAMSESEQDALLSRMEKTQHHRSIALVCCLAFLCTIAVAGIGSAIYAALVVGR